MDELEIVDKPSLLAEAIFNNNSLSKCQCQIILTHDTKAMRCHVIPRKGTQNIRRTRKNLMHQFFVHNGGIIYYWYFLEDLKKYSIKIKLIKLDSSLVITGYIGYVKNLFGKIPLSIY